MGREEKKFHFIYKTTDLRNQNFYVGMHSTNNLDDGYIGSGTRLKHLIYKHGKNIFNMEILEFLPNRKLLREREIEIINSSLLLDEKCMNLKPGGDGGFLNNEHQLKCSSAAGKKHAERLLVDEEYRKTYSEKLSVANKKRHSRGNGKKISEHYSWVGKNHSEESKRKIGETNSIKQKGENNSQYGTKWITNGTENKKIKKEEPLPKNWRYGYTKIHKSI